MPARLEVMAAAATARAMTHPLTAQLRDTEGNHYQATRLDLPPVTQMHLVCAMAGCGQSVCCLLYDITGGAYVWSLQAIAAQVAAHVLQRHSEPVPPQAARSV
jgi:hypothetical protein